MRRAKSRRSRRSRTPDGFPISWTPFTLFTPSPGEAKTAHTTELKDEPTVPRDGCLRGFNRHLPASGSPDFAIEFRPLSSRIAVRPDRNKKFFLTGVWRRRACA